jgi:tetratricopeptide (TPR) repeat protein
MRTLASMHIEAQRQERRGDVVAKLFLSYSRKDEARARRLTDWLERDSHEVWRDEDDISGGASFSGEIEKALNDCDAVVVLWSANSIQSAWVRDEAAFGRDSNKLIPISLDGTAPPLGFRQFQSIDLSKWKVRGDPSAALRIRKAISRLSGDSESNLPGPDPKPETSLPAIRRSLLAAGVLVLAAVLLLSLFLWRNAAKQQGITILVSASPNSPDQAMSADYASAAAADMAAFLPTRFDGAKIIAPGRADNGAEGYHIDVAVNRRGQAADASLTLSDRDGRSILWSKSWSVPDLSAVDLRQAVSRFASRAALCLTDAKGAKEQLNRPALNVYVSGCVGIIDSAVSEDQLSTTFERLASLAPDFPPAWAYLSVLRSFAAADSRGLAHAAAVGRAREAIATARRLNPNSGMAYLAESELVQDDRAASLALLDKGAEVEPTNAMVQSLRSDALGAVGRMSEAVEAAKRGVELDPLSPFAQSSYIRALTYAGQLSRAKADIADARKKWPNDSDIGWAEFGFQYRYGDPHVAEQLLTKVLDFSDAQLAPYRKLVAARLNPSAANVDGVLEILRSEARNDPEKVGKLILALGLFARFDEVFQTLSDPRLRSFVDASLFFRPEFAPVRADPRFMSVAARAGLVRYWRQSGEWPDFCSNEQLKYDCKAEAAKYRS